MNPRLIWDGSDLASRLVRLALTPASWLYAAGWQTYLGIYRLGFKRAAYPHPRVICVGNLVTGGSGKSPVVIYLAGLLRRHGHQVVIGCSGYGAPHAEAATIAPDGPLNPFEWGDEPAMIRSLMPDVPLVVGRRRVLAAELVHREFPDSVLLMDDGFQHMPLRKTVSIILDEPKPKNTHCLPAGPYREPRSNRNRADLVIPGDFQITSLPGTLRTPEGAEFSPTTYSVLCGLGQPDRFVRSLSERLGPASTTVLLADHDPMGGGTILDTLPEHLPIVVTVKDWVKLRERSDLGSRTFLIASQSVKIEPEELFLAWLKERLVD